MPKRILEGVVVSDKMDKTIVVAVEDRVKHALYGKVLRKTSRLKAHDETNACHLGDVVRIAECRPYSKDKKFRVIEILSRGDVADIAPSTIGRDEEIATQVSPKAEARS